MEIDFSFFLNSSYISFGLTIQKAAAAAETFIFLSCFYPLLSFNFKIQEKKWTFLN